MRVKNTPTGSQLHVQTGNGVRQLLLSNWRTETRRDRSSTNDERLRPSYRGSVQERATQGLFGRDEIAQLGISVASNRCYKT